MRRLLFAALFLLAQAAGAGEELILTARYPDGEAIPYVLDSEGPAPKYVLILFPGGSGNVDPHMENGSLVYAFRGNFLVRSRPYLVDRDFATVTTNSTRSEERMQGLLDDLGRRFPKAEVYLVGTSYGTYYTMALAGFLSGRIAGVIHTATLGEVRDFDTRGFANRHVLVHHRADVCPGTLFYDIETAHRKYGTELIVMEGGASVGHLCQAQAHHGFYGIERETMEEIRKWVRRGR